MTTHHAVYLLLTVIIFSQIFRAHTPDRIRSLEARSANIRTLHLRLDYVYLLTVK